MREGNPCGHELDIPYGLQCYLILSFWLVQNLSLRKKKDSRLSSASPPECGQAGMTKKKRLNRALIYKIIMNRRIEC